MFGGCNIVFLHGSLRQTIRLMGTIEHSDAMMQSINEVFVEKKRRWGVRHQRTTYMRTRSALHLLFLGASMCLSGCVSYAMRWKIPPPTVGDLIGAAVVDVVTLPGQAVVIPMLYGVEACQRAHGRLSPDKGATSKVTRQGRK